MGSAFSSQEIYQQQARQIKANQPTPTIDFIPQSSILTCLFYIVIFGGISILIIWNLPLEDYNKLEAILPLLVSLAITFCFILWALKNIKNKNKPILTLSEEGIFVRNMRRPIPLEHIGQINLKTISWKGNELWEFDFQLLPSCPDIGLKFTPFIHSNYKRSKRFYSLKSQELKDYTIEQVKELVIEYREIVIARNLIQSS